LNPQRPLLVLACVWAALAAASTVWTGLHAAWLFFGLALVLVAAFDLWQSRALDGIEFERSCARTLAIGTWNPVTATLHNRSPRTLSAQLFEHLPSSFEVRELRPDVRLAPGDFAEVRYRVRPGERGPFKLDKTELAVRSPLGLWRRSLVLPTETEVRVFPNFREIGKYELLAAENRTNVLGVRRRPRRGEGLNFHQLREYRSGDSLRQIDWKATSRLQKAISREYQDERDQQIFFLLDCGFKMHSRDGKLSHFDHALNALLLLSHVALRQGDAVGLMTFSGESRWLPPRKGNGQLQAIIRSVYDLQTTLRPSDYLRAAQSLRRRLPKRSLVIVVSNLRDEDHDELSEASRLLRQKHLVLAASMKERALSATLDRDVRSFDQALRVAATHQYLESRERAHRSLSHSGVLTLDAEPNHLAVQLVNGYLDIKSAGLL